MLKNKHVLVLGAGASVDYGFPTGIQLCEQVSQDFQVGLPGEQLLANGFGFTPQALQEFREALFLSGKDSVDQFLEHRPNFMEVGKAAIAYSLIRKESSARLFEYKNNWLRALFSRINSSLDDFTSKKLSIITFNYDRCVEYFLHTAIMNSFDLTAEKAADVLSNVPIIHLHGQLGFLPWARKPPADTREFVSAADFQSVRAGMRNIKIIHEGVDDRDEDFKNARGLLQDADLIMFLGFGYHPTNMDRLELSSLAQKRIIGTAIGFGQQRKQQVEDYFRRNIPKPQNVVTRLHLHNVRVATGPPSGIYLEDRDCAHFIREFME